MADIVKIKREEEEEEEEDLKTVIKVESDTEEVVEKVFTDICYLCTVAGNRHCDVTTKGEPCTRCIDYFRARPNKQMNCNRTSQTIEQAQEQQAKHANEQRQRQQQQRAHAYQQLAHQQLLYQQPMHQQPMYQQPMHQQPMYQQPMYQQPIYLPGPPPQPNLVDTLVQLLLQRAAPPLPPPPPPPPPQPALRDAMLAQLLRLPVTPHPAPPQAPHPLPRERAHSLLPNRLQDVSLEAVGQERRQDLTEVGEGRFARQGPKSRINSRGAIVRPQQGSRGQSGAASRDPRIREPITETQSEDEKSRKVNEDLRSATPDVYMSDRNDTQRLHQTDDFDRLDHPLHAAQNRLSVDPADRLSSLASQQVQQPQSMRSSRRPIDPRTRMHPSRPVMERQDQARAAAHTRPAEDTARSDVDE